MGYKFEFYDYRGNLTRQGQVPETNIVMMTTDNDYRYVIKQDVYPYAVVKEGFFKKSRSFDSKTEIGAFSVSKYDEVEFVLNQEIDDIEYYINDNSVDFQRSGSLLIAPNIPGTHRVVNPKNKEQVWFRVKDMKSLETIKTLSDNKDTEDLINQALIDYEKSEMTLHEVLLDLLKHSSKENVLHYHRMMAKFENLYNEAIKNETKSVWTIENKFDCKIIPNGEIDKVIIYELQRDRKVFKKAIKVTNETNIVMDSYKPYLIEGYKGNLFVSSRLVTAVPSEARTEKWREVKLNEERLSYLIQKGRISSSGIPEEIEEEVFLISSEGMISTRYGAPSIIDNDEEIIFEFEDHFLATDFKERIHLCIATKRGFINREYWLKKEIKNNEISIKTFDAGLSREETYFVWIENHLGDVVSEFNVLFPREHSEERNMALQDYFVKKEKEIIVERVINANKDQFERLITDYYASYGDTVNRVTRLLGLISDLYKKSTWETAHIVFDMVYDLLTKNDIKIDGFFDSSLQFSNWTRRITIPDTKRDFVLIVHSFNDYQKKVTKHVVSNPKHFDVEEEYAIIQFLDLNEGVSSHYAFVGGKHKNPIQINRGLEIEVIDDVHLRYKK